jgi:hypothetical protein
MIPILSIYLLDKLQPERNIREQECNQRPYEGNQKHHAVLEF